MDAIFTFDDTSVTLLHTSMVNYEFVMAYNNAHRIRMVRVQDMDINGSMHPCFLFDDLQRRLTHVLIERPLAGGEVPFDRYDKLLLVRGRDTWEFQEELYQHFVNTVPQPDSTEPLLVSDWRAMQDFYGGIFAMDTFCFSARRGFSSSLAMGGEAMKVPKVTQRFLKGLERFLLSTFETLQWELGEAFDN